MRKIVFLALAILVTGAGYASETDTPLHERKAKIIISQIYGMLSEKPIPDEIRGSKAEVRVAVDDGNYLRILSVETENEKLEAFLRNSIDFEKLTKGTFEKGIVYRVPIEVRK